MCYFLMTGKSEHLHNNIFAQFLSFADKNDIELAPSYIISDGGQAVINCARYYFSSSLIKLCYFHIKQSLWRTLGDLKLQSFL